jgi:arsenite methyltransferase
MGRTEGLRSRVCDAYSAAAQSPNAKHPFPVGECFGESLGYPRGLLERMPAVALEAFTGVSNVSLFAHLPIGATVLDLGCGAGLDSLIAAEKIGPLGQVLGVDFSQAMLDRARLAAIELRTVNVYFFLAAAETLPIADDGIDVALVNGIFNLNPARERIFRELARVIRPGGNVYSAELILSEPLLRDEDSGEENWFA